MYEIYQEKLKEQKVEFCHIVACDGDYSIGKNNKLLFMEPEDATHFKELTTGHILVMGRKTFESMDCKPLKNRISIVVTSNVGFVEKYKNSGAFFVADLNESLYNCLQAILTSNKKILEHFTPSKKIFIIGGTSIFEQTVNIIDTLYLTVLPIKFTGTNEDIFVKYPISYFSKFSNWSIEKTKECKSEKYRTNFNIYKLVKQ